MPTEREQLEAAIVALEAQRAILGDAVVDATLATLKEKLASLAAPPPPTDEQRKQVTVLFADVSGFTAMSETMDAEEVRDTMNALWQRLDAAITDQGGTIDKHIGDAVMALFGAPTAREDDPERAVRAALAMQAQLAEFSNLPEIQRHGTGGLRMRIGINTGPVLLGSVGTTGEYTAMGDTVNLASRLEHAAPVGGILIAHNTYRHIRSLFEVQSLDPISVKGKTEPIQVYVVLRAAPRAFRLRTRGVEGIETAMIGRDAELHRMQELMHEVVEEHEPSIITIVGEAGVGKSRLLFEFDQWMQREFDQIWLGKGRAEEQTGQIPYGLLRDLFARAFGIQESDPPALARDKLVDGFRSFLGQAGDERAHFIGQLLGYDFADSPHLRGILGDAKQIRDRAFYHAVQFFSLLAASRNAAVLFLDDIHWADDGSLDLIDHVVRNVRDVPLMVVVLTRETLFERRPLWGEGRTSHLRVDLHPLSRRDSRRLIGEILKQLPDVPDELRDLIINGSDGNPFYVEELIKMLIEDGVIIKGEPTWRVELSRLAAIHVPPTLTGVLQARLDNLESLEREVLQQASVVGKVFWDDAVHTLRAENGAATNGNETPDEGAVLNDLRGKELIFGREASMFADTAEYTFKHDILHKVTYESVLRRLRRTYHQQVAAWLMKHSGERVAQNAGLIGEHYERAGDTDQAIQWYEKAGDGARAAYANGTAIEYYKRLLNLLTETRKGATLLKLGEVQQLIGEWDDAESSFRQALACAESAHDATLEAQCQTDLGGLLVLKDPAASQQWLEQARRNWEALGDRRGLSKALANLGQAHFHQGDYERALACYAERHQIAQALADRLALSETLGHMGNVYYHMGDVERALTLHDQRIQIATELGDRRGVCASLGNIGLLRWTRGDFMGALTSFEQGMEIAREIGDRLYLSSIVANSGLVYMEQGEYEQALAVFKYSLQIASDMGDAVGITHAIYSIAYTYYVQGDWAEADPLYALAIARCRETDTPYYLCEYLSSHAALRAAQERYAEAQTLNDEALAIATQIGEADTQFRAQLLAVRLRHALGQADAAAAVTELEAMLASDLKDDQQAAVHHEIWRLDAAQEAHAAAASALYRKLYAKTPNREYRQRYAALTGGTLPEPSPLPNPPRLVLQQRIDLAALLAKADPAKRPAPATATP